MSVPPAKSRGGKRMKSHPPSHSHSSSIPMSTMMNTEAASSTSSVSPAAAQSTFPHWYQSNNIPSFNSASSAPAASTHNALFEQSGPFTVLPPPPAAAPSYFPYAWKPFPGDIDPLLQPPEWLLPPELRGQSPTARVHQWMDQMEGSTWFRYRTMDEQKAWLHWKETFMVATAVKRGVERGLAEELLRRDVAVVQMRISDRINGFEEQLKESDRQQQASFAQLQQDLAKLDLNRTTAIRLHSSNQNPDPTSNEEASSLLLAAAAAAGNPATTSIDTSAVK